MKLIKLLTSKQRALCKTLWSGCTYLARRELGGGCESPPSLSVRILRYKGGKKSAAPSKFTKLKVSELKILLKDLGLSTAGKKAELAQRLAKAMSK